MQSKPPPTVHLSEAEARQVQQYADMNGLTLEQAADALGISRRMLIYYRDGEKPIPRSIWLACLGWEAVRPQGRELPKRIPSAREHAAAHA